MSKTVVSCGLALVTIALVGCGSVRLNPAYFPGSAKTASPAGIQITASQKGTWIGLVRAQELDSGTCAPIPYKDNSYRPRVVRWKSVPARFAADELKDAACWIIAAYPPGERPDSNYVSFMSLPSTNIVVGGNELVPESHHFEI